RHAVEGLVLELAQRRIVYDEVGHWNFHLEPRLLELRTEEHVAAQFSDRDYVIMSESGERTAPVDQPMDVGILHVDLIEFALAGGLEGGRLSRNHSRSEHQRNDTGHEATSNC